MWVAAPVFTAGAATQPLSGSEILQELKNFREFATVLYVAAHPDDEDTQLITYLARARHYRTAYLSVTRGDGGQNVIGPELDSELGVIRTQELLAARRLDGGRQFFTRAIDFGYSKDYRETLRIWNKDEVLSDVVRVIRTFQPDVVIAGFAPQQTPGNHGHHVASAFLAVDAFKLAGDPKAFPDQLTYLKPWQPKRLLQRSGGFGGRGGGGTSGPGPHLEISGNDPVLGISYNEIAGRSRAMHKSQGFDNPRGFGGGGGGGAQSRGFLVLDGESTTNDIMDGIDTTWNRIPGGWQIAKLADEIIGRFDANAPDNIVKWLLVTRVNLESLPPDPQVDEKRKLLEKILQDCLGLSVVTTVPQAEVVAGEELKLHSMATVQSKIPLFWLAQAQSDGSAAKLKPGESAGRDRTLKLPAEMPLTEPYWLREDPTVGMYRVEDPRLIGTPQSAPALLITNRFQIGDSGGPILEVPVEPVQAGTESGSFEARRTLKVIAPVSVRCESEVTLFAPGASRDVTVQVTAARANTKGELSLDAPTGWTISPAKQEFHFTSEGEAKKFSFKVTAPAQIASAQITARAKVGDKVYDNQLIEISYAHIPLQVLQPPARTKAVALDLEIRGKHVGYVAGAGDSVADALKEMGYEVTTLADSDLTTNRLKDFDAVVFGIRAFEVHRDLAERLPDVFAFVESGGNVIVQYNRNVGNMKLAPYDLRVSNERVTDETAPMTFLAPDHPVLNTPNKITAADFDGWVQERGIYFPNQWDEHFTPILACADPGEAPKSGGLLVARHGKGYYVYTGLDFFRELPDGVPGAYRLFANLVSLGK